MSGVGVAGHTESAATERGRVPPYAGTEHPGTRLPTRPGIFVNTIEECHRSMSSQVARSHCTALRTRSTAALRDPLLQPLFGDGQPQHVDHLTAFTAESFGGPDRFTESLALPI